MPNHIKLDYLFEICDNDTLRVKLIIETFLVSIQEDIQNLELNQLSMSTKEMKDLAHKVKSQMKYFEAQEASSMLENIENSENEKDIKELMLVCLIELKAVVEEVETTIDSI